MINLFEKLGEILKPQTDANTVLAAVASAELKYEIQKN